MYINRIRWKESKWQNEFFYYLLYIHIYRVSTLIVGQKLIPRPFILWYTFSFKNVLNYVLHHIKIYFRQNTYFLKIEKFKFFDLSLYSPPGCLVVRVLTTREKNPDSSLHVCSGSDSTLKGCVKDDRNQSTNLAF